MTDVARNSDKTASQPATHLHKASSKGVSLLPFPTDYSLSACLHKIGRKFSSPASAGRGSKLRLTASPLQHTYSYLSLTRNESASRTFSVGWPRLGPVFPSILFICLSSSAWGTLVPGQHSLALCLMKGRFQLPFLLGRLSRVRSPDILSGCRCQRPLTQAQKKVRVRVHDRVQSSENASYPSDCYCTFTAII